MCVVLAALACEDPGVPDNGDRLLSSLLMGSVVNFTCNTGFTLSGATSITCVSDASGSQWSAPIPICVGEYGLTFAVF